MAATRIPVLTRGEISSAAAVAILLADTRAKNLALDRENKRLAAENADLKTRLRWRGAANSRLARRGQLLADIVQTVVAAAPEVAS